LHADDELWCFRLRLYLTSQPRDEHVDAAIKGFRAMPDNGMTQLVTRQYSVWAGYERGQQRGLGAGQPHFPAVPIDKGVAGQVELAIFDSKNCRRWGSLVDRFSWRCRRSAEPIKKLSLVQRFRRTCICIPQQMARSDDLVLPQHDRSWNIIAQLPA
jgi:hypothetical protein